MSRKSKQTGGSKPPLTHFLCLPLVTPASRPQLERSLGAFKAAISGSGSGENASIGSDLAGGSAPAISTIHSKAIRPIGAIHCTLGVMSMKREQLGEAVAFLRSVDVMSILQEQSGAGESATGNTAPSLDAEESSVLSGPKDPSGSTVTANPLTVDLRGIESMHPAHKTSILYIAPTDSTGRLHSFCLAVQKLFQDKGFLVPDSRELKLHATIVNTIYAKGRKRPPKKAAPPRTTTSKPLLSIDDSDAPMGGSDEKQEDRSQGHGPNANAPLKIDATAILESYKDHCWAKDIVLNRIAICEMGAKKITDANGNVIDEQYAEVASKSLLAA